MNLGRVAALTMRVVMQFKYDRRTLVFVVVVPLLMISLFGYTFGGDVKHIKVVVADLDEGYSMSGPMGNVTVNLGDDVLDYLKKGETLDITLVSDVSQARQDVRDARYWALIVIPANFSREMVNAIAGTGDGAHISIDIDGSNPNIASAVVGKVRTSIAGVMSDMAERFNASSAPPDVDVDYIYGSEDLEFIDYFSPGIMGYAIMMVTIMLTILTFVQERRADTLDRLLSTPATEGEIVLGYALGFSIVGTLQSAVVLGAGILLFDIHVQGTLIDAFIVIILTAAGSQGLGILLSSWARNELQAVQMLPLIIFPAILLTGLFWPVESIPAFLQPLSYFVPLTYTIDALRSVMVRGWGLDRLGVDLAVLIGFALLTLGGSVAMLRKRD